MRLTVKVTPNASRNQIKGRAADDTLHVRIQSPPVDGAANKGLIKFLAKTAGVSKSKVRILSGDTSRVKRVEIDGDETAILDKLDGAS